MLEQIYGSKIFIYENQVGEYNYSFTKDIVVDVKRGVELVLDNKDLDEVVFGNSYQKIIKAKLDEHEANVNEILDNKVYSVYLYNGD